MEKSCRGCGSVLDLTDEQIRQVVDEVLEETRPEIKPLPGVCPLCGRSSTVPVSHRKSVQFGLLVALLALVSVLAIAYYLQRDTERQQVARQATQQAQSNADVVRHLGVPITVRSDVSGQVKEDETGWQEARLTVPVVGPLAEGVLTVIGGRSKGEWRFTTFEVLIPKARKRVDLVSGLVVDYDPEAYVQVHTMAAATPEYTRSTVPPARFSGNFPCVAVDAVPGAAPRIGECEPPIPIAALKTGPLDRFEVDLRFGKFSLHETDLFLKDGALDVPFTRSYNSRPWFSISEANAFGRWSTHDFDIAPVATRNPYTELLIVLPNAEFLHFPRISRGTGYADAVYQHSETSSRFYGAVTSWNGNGWDTKLADGSRLRFPESYHAKNMAQGAPTEMTDANGHTVQLGRDAQRNLKEIRTPGGRWIKLSHDEKARVVRAEDDERRWVTYDYSPSGLLVEVRHSDGRARRYTYEGDYLAAVRDQTGRLLLRNSYQQFKVARQDYADGQSYQFHYTLAAIPIYAVDTRVVLPDGSSRSFHTADSVPQYVKDMRPGKQ